MTLKCQHKVSLHCCSLVQNTVTLMLQVCITCAFLIKIELLDRSLYLLRFVEYIQYLKCLISPSLSFLLKVVIHWIAKLF